MRVTVTDEQIRQAFVPMMDNCAMTESSATVRDGKRPAEMLQAMCLRPELLAGFGALSDAVYPGGIIERDVKEIVILEASRRNACQFCYNSHNDMIQTLGLAPDAATLLDNPQALNPRQRLAMQYTAHAMTDSNKVPERFFDELREHYSEPEIVELTMCIGYINMLNMFNNCLQVRYNNDYRTSQDS